MFETLTYADYLVQKHNINTWISTPAHILAKQADLTIIPSMFDMKVSSCEFFLMTGAPIDTICLDPVQ